MNTAQTITLLIEAHRFDESSERRFQDGIAKVLTEAGIEFEREVWLTPHDVVDFMVGDVAIECKTGGGLSAVTRQLHRYAQVEGVKAIVLATTRLQLARVPGYLNEKPVHVAATIGGLA